MDVSKILQECIININPQVFLNQLILFNLISDNEYETLQNSTAWEEQQKSNTALTTFIVLKLNQENAVYHERFKLFLGYYDDLKSIYRNWDSIGRTFTVLLLLQQHFL